MCLRARQRWRAIPGDRVSKRERPGVHSVDLINHPIDRGQIGIPGVVRPDLDQECSRSPPEVGQVVVGRKDGGLVRHVASSCEDLLEPQLEIMTVHEHNGVDHVVLVALALEYVPNYGIGRSLVALGIHIPVLVADVEARIGPPVAPLAKRVDVGRQRIVAHRLLAPINQERQIRPPEQVVQPEGVP